MAEHEHRWSPMIMGVGGKEYLRCQDCPHDEEITDEMRTGWVAEGVEYHGVMGDYWPPGSGPERLHG